MDALSIIILVILVVVVAAAAAVALLMLRRRRSAQLKDRFGSEYQRTVEDADGRRTAEKDLRRREKRREAFQVRPLSTEAVKRYHQEWDGIQQRFVDEPGRAVEQADSLVVRMMRERGYPVDDFDQRADDVSVDHPEVAYHYRDAHGVAVAQIQGQADTEQLRLAVTSYRALVDALLDGQPSDTESGDVDSDDTQHGDAQTSNGRRQHRESPNV